MGRIFNTLLELGIGELQSMALIIIASILVGLTLGSVIGLNFIYRRFIEQLDRETDKPTYQIIRSGKTLAGASSLILSTIIGTLAYFLLCNI